MTLLDSIKKAAAEADAGNLLAVTKFPIILNSDAVLSNLKPEAEAPNGGAPLIKRVSGWQITETDAEIVDLSAKLSKSLKRKLKNPRSLYRDELLGLLSSFLAKNAERIRLPIGLDPSDPDFTCSAIGKLGFLISREIAGLIAEGCLLLDVWEVLETLILHGLVVGNLTSAKLIEKLVEKNRPELLCLCVKHISDLRSSEVLSILKCFLSPSRDCYVNMIGVRKEWEIQALLAIEKATQKGVPRKAARLAKEASILLMMANDGFSSPDSCLHYVFGTSGLDGLVLASAISRLNGSEVLGLVRYFMKWLEKYQRFPEAVPCPSAGSVLGLRVYESIPSLEAVVSGLGLVLDEHFSYLVLNSQFHDEMMAIEKVVGSLASEAGSCCPLDDIIKHLQSEVRQHEYVGRHQT